MKLLYTKMSCIFNTLSHKASNKLNEMKNGGQFHQIFRLGKTYPKHTKTNKIYDTALTPTTDPLQNDVFTETQKSLPKPTNFLQIPQKCHHHRTSTKTPKTRPNPGTKTPKAVQKHLETHQKVHNT